MLVERCVGILPIYCGRRSFLPKVEAGPPPGAGRTNGHWDQKGFPSHLCHMFYSSSTASLCFITFLVMPIPQRGNVVLHQALSYPRSSSTCGNNALSCWLWLLCNGTLCIVSTINPQRRWRRLHGRCKAIPGHDSNAKDSGKTAKHKGDNAAGGEPVQGRHCQKLHQAVTQW